MLTFKIVPSSNHEHDRLSARTRLPCRPPWGSLHGAPIQVGKQLRSSSRADRPTLCCTTGNQRVRTATFQLPQPDCITAIQGTESPPPGPPRGAATPRGGGGYLGIEGGEGFSLRFGVHECFHRYSDGRLLLTRQQVLHACTASPSLRTRRESTKKGDF